MKKQWSLAGFTEPYMQDVERVMDSADWSDPEIYGNWLAQTYYYVCHSTRLLAAAASRSYVDRDNLHVQQMNHMSEERNHEKLAAADLKAVGRGLGDFPELTGTKNLYRSTYFLIERVNPLCMYGYVYFLEALSLRRGNVVMAAAKAAFGAEAIRYLKLHASEDEGHILGYAKVIEALPAEDRAFVEEGLVTAAQNYRRMVEEVKLAKESSRRAKRAA